MMSLGLGLAEPSGAHTPLLVTQGRVTFGLFIYGQCVKQKRRHAYHLAVKILFYNLNTAPPLVPVSLQVTAGAKDGPEVALLGQTLLLPWAMITD